LSGHTHTDNRPGIGPDTVIFGIGNSGRSDDGLGWAFLDCIAKEPGFSGRVEYRYQLGVEDAALIRDMQQVIFVDSHRGDLHGGFQWKPCKPSADFEFTTHVLPPGAVLFLCEDLYGQTPRADLLMIQGSTWELQVGLSQEADQRLEKALGFFRTEVMCRSESH